MYIPEDNEIHAGQHQIPTMRQSDSTEPSFQMVSFELLPIEAVPLRMIKCPGGFYKGTPFEILKSITSTAIDRIKIGGKDPYDFMEVTEPNIDYDEVNLDVVSNINLTALPEYINSKTGISTSGLGVYVKHKQENKYDRVGIYIYPIYNPYRFREKVNKLKVIIDGSVTPEVSKTTYKTEGKLTTIVVSPLTTRNSKSSSSDTDEYGFIGSSAEGTASMEVTASKQSASVDSKKMKTAVKLTDTGGNENNPRIAVLDKHRTVVDEMVDIAAVAGEDIAVKWSYSDPEVLYPSMPVSVLMAVMGKPVLREATLLHAHTVYKYIEDRGTYLSVSSLRLRIGKVL
jgi:hypothetical protein